MTVARPIQLLALVALVAGLPPTPTQDGGRSRDCPPIPDDVLASAGLPPSAGDGLCWRGPDALAAARAAPLATSSGVPPGVNCTTTDWCDAAGRCTTVCARGGVQVDPWLASALATQRALAARLPFCYAPLVGTHNSAVTLADGYGARDDDFRALFTWVKWVRDADAPLRTNNQHLSLTDQLRLGVRAVELDVHWVAGALRIAHCGGLHSRALDGLVAALNAAAALVGRPFRWDVETVGCSPSLSSIGAADQRLFADAVAEVGAWLAANPDEFVLLYLDDQADLGAWGLLPALEDALVGGLPSRDALFTPADLAGAPWHGVWPSTGALVAAGKRAAAVSATDYGAAAPTLFARNGPNVCGWVEPKLASFRGAPACDAVCGPKEGCAAREMRRTLDGRLLRLLTCELQYGPLNCDFKWSPDNDPLLDESSLADVVQCGVNQPCPDSWLPSRAAATVWTWAPGHPPAPPPPPRGRFNWRAWLAKLAAWLRWSRGLCGCVTAADGRWRARRCADAVVTACRGVGAPPGGRGNWTLGYGRRGVCPPGTEWSPPLTPREGAALAALLRARRHDGAWLPTDAGAGWRLRFGG